MFPPRKRFSNHTPRTSSHCSISPLLHRPPLNNHNRKKPLKMEKGLVSVDRWVQGSQAYFLTHLHSDHTKGLSSSWSHGLLFCSPTTAKLLPFKFPDFDLSLLRILHVGTTHTLSLRSPSSSSTTTVLVTAIDACHCPGSIMLLFRGEFGCVLHTGDFRWEIGSEKVKMATQVLHTALDGEDGVDVLYLDNTYANPTYDFPSREVAARKVIDLVKSHPDHDIIIGISSLGKEDLLVQIAIELNIKVCVWPERLRTMRILGLPDVFTTDTTITRVRAVPQCSLKIDTLEKLNHRRPTIGILPSGLPWAKKYVQRGEFLSGSFLTLRYKRDKWSANSEDQNDKPIGNTEPPEQIHHHMYAVPYSEHSNYSEIEDFIKLAKPTSIKGIVSASECYIEPMYFFGRLCRVNQPKQELHNRCEVKDSGKRVETVSPETSLGDDVKLHRYGGRTSRFKLLGVRKRRLSVLIRKRRGVKIVDIDSPEIVGN